MRDGDSSVVSRMTEDREPKNGVRRGRAPVGGHERNNVPRRKNKGFVKSKLKGKRGVQ